jgi:pSer/pThr/pTyr-binding forkhead associated (FHA) protein
MSPQISVMIINGANDGQVYTFDMKARIRIGRDLENEITLLDDPAVSRYHGEIMWDNGYWILRDLDSQNGIFVEGTGRLGINSGTRVRGEVSIDGGQLFRIGRTWLRFQTVEWAAYA